MCRNVSMMAILGVLCIQLAFGADDNTNTATTRAQRYTALPQPTPQNQLQDRQYFNIPAEEEEDSRPQATIAYRRPYDDDALNKVQRKQPIGSKEAQQLLEEEEIEEPDRLTVLLPSSTFTCQGRGTGYYADEGLGCEVFHYCQDNAKHSWVCPEGFAFHQIHLICMPPSSSEDICKQSSQYHFVNDFLYKPINEEEHAQKPNVSLRYSDRYYPENVHQEYAEESSDDARQQYINPSRQPLQVGLPRRTAQQQQQQQQQSTTPYRQQQQSTTPYRQQQQQQQPSTPLPYRQQQQQQQVFRSPEEVNISLQQRRPATVQQSAARPDFAEQYDEQEYDST